MTFLAQENFIKALNKVRCIFQTLSTNLMFRNLAFIMQAKDSIEIHISLKLFIEFKAIFLKFRGI